MNYEKCFLFSSTTYSFTLNRADQNGRCNKVHNTFHDLQCGCCFHLCSRFLIELMICGYGFVLANALLFDPSKVL